MVVDIPHCEIVTLLDHTDFGAVARVKEAETGIEYVAKVAFRREGEDEDSHKVRRLLHERRVLKSLSHPHVISFLRDIDTPTSAGYLCEYCTGGEVFEKILTKGPMKEWLAAKYFWQLTDAVSYCHQQRVIHCDIKPENILIDDMDMIRLADFGSSVVLNHLRTPTKGSQVGGGSLGYASPEVLSASPPAGSETIDIWSMGITLYVMVTGELPFGSDSDSEDSVVKRIKAAEYEVPSHVSRDLQDLLSSILKIDPSERPSIADIRGHRWMQMHLARRKTAERATGLWYPVEAAQIQEETPPEHVVTEAFSELACDDPSLFQRQHTNSSASAYCEQANQNSEQNSGFRHDGYEDEVEEDDEDAAGWYYG